jgi:prepilin-type N-terminal cleavage/methylation domain-containing protein
MFRIFKEKKGFSLIELLTVVAIMGIIVSVAPLGSEFIYSHRLHAASRELYSDLLAMRFAAMTQGSSSNSHGFGIRFLSESKYTVFEFVEPAVPVSPDCSFHWDALAEEVESYQKELPTGVTVSVGAAQTTPVGNANLLLYDKHGMARTWNWSSVAGFTYRLHHPKVGHDRCVVISAARIREGGWDAATNNCNEL